MLVVSTIIIMLLIFVCMRYRYDLYDSVILSLLLFNLFVYLICILNLQKYFLVIWLVLSLGGVALIFTHRISFYRHECSYITTVLTILLCCLVGVVAFGHYTVLGDAEFNYYVISVKQFFLTDSLGNGNTVVYGGFGSYTPIHSIILYYPMKLLGYWSESLVYIYNYFFCTIMCLPLLGRRRDNTFFQNGFLRMPIVLLFPLLMLADFYIGITAECLSSVLFGYALYCVYDKERYEKRYNELRIAISCSVLILVKSATILMVAVVIGAYLYSSRKQKIGSRFLLISPFCFLFIWTVYSKVNHLYAFLLRRSKETIVNHSISTLTSNFTQREWILPGFVKMLFFAPLNEGKIGITTVGAIIIIIVVCMVVHNRHFTCIEVIFFGGLLVYSISILYLYYNVFGETEGYTMNAGWRYMGGYVPGGIYLAFIALEDIFKPKKATVALLVFTLLFTNWAYVYNYFFPLNYRITNEDAIRCAEEVKSLPVWDELERIPGETMGVFYEGDMYCLIRQNIRFAACPEKVDFIELEGDEKSIDSKYSKNIFIRLSDDGRSIEKFVYME